ncbi:MAG: hypothetical protein NC099_02450 [Corallococcus sp.]|nr:hypothetical protein [Bacillota bacterium]MCM1533493.1 hypothetical protein [Corallococcus sp.]
MNDYKEMDQLVFEFGKDTQHFAQNYAGTMPSAIKSQLQDLMFTGFAKEIDAITEREQLEIKYKKKFYDKLLRAKMKLSKLDRADAWFDKVFQKYFNRGILEHLLVYGVRFLYKKDLFVPKRLFAQINNDELLAQFTAAACEYLGWTNSNELVEQTTTDETEPAEEQFENDENSDRDAETAQSEPTTDVTVYEPKEVQSIEQQAQPIVTLERTVTREVMTATQGGTIPTTETDTENGTVCAEEPTTPLQSSEESSPHRFHRPGGKRAGKV